MANRWKGNIIAATAAVSSGTDFTGKANGAWSLNSQMQQKQASQWAKGVYAPSAPTVGAATNLNASATVAFTAPTNSGGTLTYTATSTPSGITGTSPTSPVTVSGLTNGTGYTFTVHANSSLGYTSAESSPTSLVYPGVPNAPTGVSAAAGSGAATISFTAPTNTGGSTITNYTATSSPGNISATGANPITVTGLTNGTSYTFTVKANGNLGFSSVASSVSNSITPTADLIIMSTGAEPFVYSWNDGFGSRFANPTILDLSDLSIQGSALKPTKDVIAFASSYGGTTNVAAFKWSGNSGFGTRYAQPSAISATYSCLFHPTRDELAFGDSVGNTIAYAFTYAGGFGTRYNSTGGSATTVRDLSTTGSVIANGKDGTPFIEAYPWNSGSFGAKYTNPATLPTDSTYSVDFNPAGTAIVRGGGSATPRVTAYAWSSGFGTKYADPTTTSSSTCVGVDFHPSGNFVAANYINDTAKLEVWNWSNGFGTKIANPATLPSWTQLKGITFNTAGNALAVPNTSSPFVYVYAFSTSTGFGSMYANPSTLPSTLLTSLTFI